MGEVCKRKRMIYVSEQHQEIDQKKLERKNNHDNTAQSNSLQSTINVEMPLDYEGNDDEDKMKMINLTIY